MADSRREHICRLRQENPCLSLRKIGSKVGLSGERVRQILEAESQPTKAIRRLKYGRGVCPNCGKTFTKHHSDAVHCSPVCFHFAHSVPLTCDWCGRLFTRKQGEVLAGLRRSPDKKWFCNKRCQGFYVAKNYGFWAHPENTKIHRKREYCKSGRHLMSEGNLYLWRGKRRCHICMLEYGRRVYWEKKARTAVPCSLSSGSKGALLSG